MSLSLASILAESALRHPERTALVAGPTPSCGSKPDGTLLECAPSGSARATGSLS